MSRKFYLNSAILLGLSLLLWVVAPAQEVVRIGNYRFVPEQNVPLRGTRGAVQSSSLDLGEPTEGQLNVLVQFDHLPTAQQAARLAARGVTLEGYINGNAYFATLPAGTNRTHLGGLGLRSVLPIAPEWRMSPELQAGTPPEWATPEDGSVKISLHFFTNASSQQVRQDLQSIEASDIIASDLFHTAHFTLPEEDVMRLAEFPWLESAHYSGPQPVLLNNQGRVLSGANFLNQPSTLGGYNLTGKGVKVGVWDGNVQPHVDYAARLHQHEFEYSVKESQGHGMHVTGSVGSAGLLNPRATGMAPKVELHTWNYSGKLNGLTTDEEMAKCHLEDGIVLTQNSYGIPLWAYCTWAEILSYKDMVSDQAIDVLSVKYPKLTHVFAAGNDQGSCGYDYRSVTSRAKNAIYVGALKADGQMTDFSSWGPTDDGRMIPHVCAKGEHVFSTMPFNQYGDMSGTSMACPTTTGHLALLVERYRQLYNGDTPENYLLKAIVANTADDAGNKGPDYAFGYGILNVVHAVKAMDNGWFKKLTVVSGTPLDKQTINVPAGTKQLRVMLVWSDPVKAMEYRWGRNIIANDLDLVVEANGTRYLPWACQYDKSDPQNPENYKKPAIRRAIDWDNIEQVTIDNPMPGTVTVMIGGEDKISTNSEQPCALVWYFDDGVSSVTYPIGGESMDPGEKFMIRTDNIHGDALYEISFDGGVSFRSLGTQGSPAAVLTMPEDAPLGANCVVRVTDMMGNIAISRGKFQVMPVPKDLEITQDGCGTAGWKLSWQACKDVDGYRVYRADMETEEFMQIGEVTGAGSGKIEFDVPANKIDVGGTNLFCVRAVKADMLSDRSVGVLAKQTTSEPVTLASLPVREDFQKWPSKYYSLKRGRNIDLDFIEAPPKTKQPIGSYMMAAIGTKEPADWSKPFDHKDNVLEINICDLDLTAVKAGTRLVFSTLHKLAFRNDPNNIQMRLVANGNEIVPTSQGGESLAGNNNIKLSVFDISKYAGTTLSLSVQVAMRNRDLTFYMVNFEILTPSEDVDIQLSDLVTPPDGRKMGIKPLSFHVRNMSYQHIHDLPVAIKLNDEVKTSTVVADLPPFGEKTVELPVDFSVSNPSGELLNVEVIASYPNDSNPKNNALRGRVRNFGSVIPMPTSYYTQLPTGQWIQVDPSKTETVSGSAIFSDDGGLIDQYSDDQVSTIQFVPNDPNTRIKANIKAYAMYETLEFRDVLNIYDYRIGYDPYYGGFNVKNLPPTYILSKAGLFKVVLDAQGKRNEVLITDDPDQMEISSNALDGSLTFHFESAGYHRAQGWEIELSEEVKNNTMTLVDVITPSVFPEQWYPLIRVRNNTANKYDRVGVFYGLSQTQDLQDEFSLEPFEEKVIVLRDPVKIGVPFVDRFDIVVGLDPVLGSGHFLDEDMTDNLAQVPIKSDTYWTGGLIEDPAKAAIAKIILGNQIFTYLDYERHPKHLEYKLDDLRFDLYTKSVNPILIKTSHIKSEQDGGKLYMWVDLNDDGKFSDKAPEMVEATLKEGQRDYIMNLDLAGVKPGVRRARFMICGKDDMEAFKAGKTIEWGQAMDGLFTIKDKTNPSVRDLGVLNLSGPQTGVALSEQTSVSVEIINHGIKPATNIKLKLYVDPTNGAGGVDYPVATEIVKETIPPQGGIIRYTFKAKVDLSGVGDHVIQVQLPDDGSNADNRTTLNVTCLPSQSTDGVYALRMIRRITSYGQEVVENIKFADFPFALGMQAATVEMWANLSKDWTETGAKDATVCSLISSAGFTLAATYRLKDMPNRGYLIKIGNTLWATESWIIQTEKWQHYAVTFEKISDSFVRPHLYIDGEEIPLTMTRGSIGHIDFRWFFMGLRLTGYLKGLRIWNKIRTVDELKNNWLSVLRQGGDRGQLPSGCVLEMPMNEGVGAFLASGRQLAVIRNSRVNLPVSNPNSTWVKLTSFVKDVNVEGQIADTEMTEESQIDGSVVKKFTILLPYDYGSLRNIPLKVATKWPDFEVEANGKKAQNGMINLDFESNPEITLVCRHNAFFGQRVSETFKVKVQTDASTDCDLKALSVLKADNQNLKNDVRIDNVTTRSILLNLENKSASEKLDLSHLVVQIDRLSDGATLRFNGQALAAGQKVTLDLTSPKALLIVAANGRDSKSYELRIERQQSVTWPPQTLSYVFGHANVPLTATLSSGLPVSYYSSNPEVATIDGMGNLILVGAGEADITAHHPGNGSYLPSNKLVRSVTVTPKDAAIGVEPVSIEQGQRLPEFTYTSNDLVRNEKAKEYVSVPYAVFKQDGTQWDSTMPQLQPGSYEIRPVGYSAPYTLGNYNVTLQNGQLTVTPGGTVTKAFTLTLKDGTTSKADVDVTISGVVYRTDAQGMVHLMLEKGSYNYSIMLDGYAPIKADFTIEDTPVTVTENLVRVDPAELIYEVQGEGVIFGVARQTVSKGQTGSLVVAMPRVGHHFVKWTDNQSTDPTRQDVATTDSQTYTAEFAPNRVSISYMIGEGGEMVSDPATFHQELDQYTDAAPVEVRALDGYFFYRWSDGVKTLARTDLNVKENMEVKALFVRPFLLPFMENFNDMERRSNQWSIDASDRNYTFGIVAAQSVRYALVDMGNMVYAQMLHSTTERYTRLVSPRFNVAKVDGQDILIDFDYYKFAYLEGKGQLKLQYRIDGGEWMTLLEDVRGTAEAQMRHAQTILEASRHKGARYLQFSWLAQGAQTDFGVDNIEILVPDYPAFNALYFTNGFGHLQVGQKSELKDRVQLEVVRGLPGEKVLAVPQTGYSFDYWSDGRMDNPRQDSVQVSVKAFFVPDLAKNYHLVYSAEEGGHIEGPKNQRIHKYSDGVQVRAVAYSGYHFLGWSDGKFAGQATRRDMNVQENVNAKAIFAKGKIVLKYDAGVGGTMVTDARVEYANENARVQPALVKVKKGYKFLYWEDDEGNHYADNPFIYRGKQGTGLRNGEYVVFTAIYQKLPVLVYTAGKGGVLNTNERRWELSVEVGENGPSVTAIPLSGYVFERWSDGVTDNPRQDLNVQHDKSAQAIFAQKSYTLTIVVMHEGQPVTDAEVSLMGTSTTAMTNAEGKVVFNVHSGVIPYKVAKEGYLVVAENVDVRDDKSVSIDLGKLKAAQDENPVTSADESKLLANVVATPNPFNEYLRFSHVSEMQSVQVITLSGVLLRMVEHDGGETLTIKTADLPEGVYIIRMFDTEGKARLMRVVKQR